MRSLKNLLLLLFLLCTHPVLADNNLKKQHSAPYLSNGFNWQLPDYAKANSNGGLISESTETLDVPFAPNHLLLIRWDQANPQQNQYDFSTLETFLDKHPERKLLIRLEVNSACEAPTWAMKQLKTSKDHSLIYWDGNYRRLLKPFSHAFAHKFAASQQIIGLQLGIGDGEYKGSCDRFENKDGWGEFWMTDHQLAEAEDAFGLTPQKFKAETIAIIDDYIAAFGKHKNKLAFTNFEPFYSWGERADAYNQLLTEIAHYALQKGLGNRDGAIEEWMRYTHPSYGIKFTSSSQLTCSMEMDESFATQIAARYWGTENEFYGELDYVTAENGPRYNQAYRFMVSSLRALQMRRNYFSINAEQMQHIGDTKQDKPFNTQAFLSYLSKTLGSTIEDTADAFILLGERFIGERRLHDYANLDSCLRKNDKNKYIAIRSFSRWLSEKSNSKPAMKVNMPESEAQWGQSFYLPYGIDYEYAARTGTQFTIKLNQQLTTKRCGASCDIDVKVTFRDDSTTKLHIQHGEQTTATIETLGDKKIKTANFAFTLNPKENSDQTSFLIHSQIPVSIMLVRLNFLTPP